MLGQGQPGVDTRHHAARGASEQDPFETRPIGPCVANEAKQQCIHGCNRSVRAEIFTLVQRDCLVQDSPDANFNARKEAPTAQGFRP